MFNYEIKWMKEIKRGLKGMKVKGPPQYILGLKKTSLAVSFLLKPITLFGLKEKLSHHFRVFSQNRTKVASTNFHT